jgi:hypothetical protein
MMHGEGSRHSADFLGAWQGGIAGELPMVWTNRIANQLSPLLPLATPELPSTLSARLRSRLRCVPLQPPPLSSIAKGDRVRICKGVFCGVEGTVVGHRGKGRLIVAVELLEQGVTVELDSTMVQSLEAHRRFGFRS